MSLFDRNLNIFKALKPTYTRKRIGYLGRYNTDGSIDPDPRSGLPADYCWVRFDADRGGTRVKNLRVRAEWGTPVWVEFNELTREDEVREVHGVLAPQTFGGSVAAALNVPAIPAGVSTPTSARDIIPGGVFADSGGGLVVRIMPTWIPGSVWWDGSTLIALTPTATASNRSFAVVGITRAGTAEVSLTADRGLTFPVIDGDGNLLSDGAIDIKAVMDAASDVFWVGAVLLANGATAIDSTRMYDLRFWRLPTMTGADGSNAGGAGLVPAPGATDDGKFLCGDGTWQVAGGGSGNVSTGSAVDIPRLEFDSDAEPASPDSDDDEFAGSSLDGDWSWVNQGSATAAVAKSRLLLTVPSTSTGNIRGIFRTYPGQSTWIAQITGWSSLPSWSGSNNYSASIARRDSSSGRIETYGMGWDSSGTALLMRADQWTNPTTYSAGIGTNVQLGRVAFGTFYLKLVDDNTNVAVSWSLDGVHYTQWASFARASFLASADQIGLVVFTQQSGGTIYLQSDWMRQAA